MDDTPSGAAARSSGARDADRHSDDVESVRIGAKLKHARLTLGYTLRELADIVGCSESMVSKVENDRLRPSLAMLHRFASALGTNMAALLSEEDDLSNPVRIFPAEKRKRVQVNSKAAGIGTWFERIVPTGRGGLLQANILNVAPGGESDGVVDHVGEDFGYVIEGELELIVDGAIYPVREGDAFFFPSTLPHGHRNRSLRKARVLWVNTPPTL